MTSPTHPDDATPTAWVSVAEAAEKSGVGTSTVRQWYRSGRLPTQRAQGDKGAFLVPLDAVLALANRADEEGDDLGAAVIDLNASYWSAQTEAAREEAAEAKRELAQVQADLAEAESELDEFEAEVESLKGERDAALEQLGFLRSQLAEASEESRRLRERAQGDGDDQERLDAENRSLRGELASLRLELQATTDELSSARGRLAVLDEELTALRAVTSKAGSITDNSWIDLPTNTYRSPVRPQGLAAAAGLSDLLASTQPDQGRKRAAAPEPDDEPEVEPEPERTRSTPARTMFDDVNQRPAKAASRPAATARPVADPDPVPEDDEYEEYEDEELVDPAAALAAVAEFGFGSHDDDLLPEPEAKKGRRGRK
jgi:hypothetical protein